MKKLIILILCLFYALPLLAASKYNIVNNAYTGQPDMTLYPDNTAPTAASDTCDAGTIAYESGYFYICVAADTWQRVVIATWALTDKMLLDDGSSHVLLDDGTSKILIRP